MRHAAPLSILLCLSGAGCGDSDKTNATPSSPSASAWPAAPPGRKDLEALTKTPLTAQDIERYLTIYPAIRKTKNPEDIRAAAATQGLSFQEAMFLVARVNTAYMALQTKAKSTPLGGNAADVEAVRPYEARIKAVIVTK
jgi:hypothetical protein